jgi:hypothetical protein
MNGSKRTRPKSSSLAIVALLVGAALVAVPDAVATSNIPSECVGGEAPDIRTGSPDQLQLVHHSQRDWVRFTNRIANTGEGDLRLRSDPPPRTSTTDTIGKGYQQITDVPASATYKDPTLIPTVICEELVSTFVYHPAHRHWHLANIALYEVHKALDTGTGGSWDPATVTNDKGEVMSVKSSFCLIDVQALDTNSWSAKLGSYYFDCFNEFQGISPRWSDTYKGEVEGQELDVTGIGNGTYYLVSTANFLDSYLESDLSNDTAWRSFRLTHDAKGNPQLRVISGNSCNEPTLCAGNKGFNR